MARRLPILALLLALTGCAALPGFAPPPPKLYRLTPKHTFAANLPTVHWQLLVETPTADPGIDTPRIALDTAPTNLDYFANVSWVGRLPEMVQTELVESFASSGRITSIGRDTIGLRADYVLETEIRGFQAEYKGDPKTTVPTVHVRMNFRLVSAASRTIVATTTFDERWPARANRMHDIVDAFDEAVGKMMKRVVAWTLLNGQADRRNPADRYQK